MTTQTDTSTLNDLIAVLEDGRAFYSEAADKVDRGDLKALFGRMASTKKAILTELRSRVAATGDSPSDGSFAGSVRKTYADLKARMSKDTDAEYIAQLEEFEDRILDEFRDALQESEDVEVQALAAKYMPQVQLDHDEMKALKDAVGKGK